MPTPQDARDRMVSYQIAARGIRDPALLAAMRTVPREAFVPAHLASSAHDDRPLPIGQGQTISQPYVVAWMIDALDLSPGARVLEIGTGSGYAAAVLAAVPHQVWTIERHAPLAENARERLAALGFRGVHVRTGDGTRGWPEAAPFDGILVAAGAPAVPAALKTQLALGGRLVLPVGVSKELQMMQRITRHAEDDYQTEDLGECRFVPLVGEHGW